MEHLFSAYLQAGLYGTVILSLVILTRVLLKKASRRVLLLLWIPVAVRLLLPFQLQSQVSLQPQVAQLPAAQVQQVQTVAPTAQDIQPQEEPKVNIALFASGVWAGGVALCALYTIGSYLALRLRLRGSIPAEEGVRESYSIGGAFLLGYLRPRIYLPIGLEGQRRQMILAHERAHIARADHWWKLAGFFCVCLHWYNPLVWVGYSLFCRDIEAACDEQVVCKMDGEERKAYSLALLDSGKRLAGLSTCPVAFGEVSVKARIKQVLAYRKPAMWLGVITAVAVAVLGVFFLTSPMAQAQEPKPIPGATVSVPEQKEEQPEQTNQFQQVQTPVVEDTPDEEEPAVEDTPDEEEPVVEDTLQEESQPQTPAVNEDSTGLITDMIQSTQQAVVDHYISRGDSTLERKYPGHNWYYNGQSYIGANENGAAEYACTHCSSTLIYQVKRYNFEKDEYEYVDFLF